MKILQNIFSCKAFSIYLCICFFLNEIWILCMNFVFSVCGCYVLIERSSFLFSFLAYCHFFLFILVVMQCKR